MEQQRQSQFSLYRYSPFYTKHLFYGGISLIIMSAVGAHTAWQLYSSLQQSETGIYFSNMPGMIGGASLFLLCFGVLVGYIGLRQNMNKKVWLDSLSKPESKNN
jgi:hypothetical protein